MSSFFSDYQPERTVRPKNAGEVQEIIKKANKNKTPLVPVSSGTNLQGTHLPSVKGATAVDLSLMKGVYFDEGNRNVVVEPGVTFADLAKQCKKAGLKTLTAIDIPKDASVLSTYLEMNPLYDWPKYHPWEMLTMEGYRADGQHFATGQMAMSQDRPDKYSWGCSFAMVSRLFCQAQGTLGIITKVAVTLKTAFPKSDVLYFDCRNVNQATKALKAFMATEEPHEIFAVNKTYLAELLGVKLSGGLAPWTVVLVNRGADKAEISYKRKDAVSVGKALGGKVRFSIKGVPQASEKILAEITSPTGAAVHSGSRGWAPVVSIATAKQVEKCSGLFSSSSGAILLPLQAGGAFYYQSDLRFRASEIPEVRKKYIALCSKMLKAGVVFPRPSALIAQQVAKQYPDNFKLLRSIKQAVDPNNIMNPGKLGL